MPVSIITAQKSIKPLPFTPHFHRQPIASVRCGGLFSGLLKISRCSISIRTSIAINFQSRCHINAASLIFHRHFQIHWMCPSIFSKFYFSIYDWKESDFFLSLLQNDSQLRVPFSLCIIGLKTDGII